MVFLDPRNDVAFKKLFGDQTKKGVLIHFLNAVLERKEGERITDVVYNDPYNHPETKNMKLSIVDVSATDEQGKNYIIEVQVSPQPDYGMRAQYYSSLAVSRQLGVAGKYGDLTPVIFVGVLDFSLFVGQHYLSHHQVLDTVTKANELTLMEWHFIELPKFNLKLEVLKTIIEKWVYLLQNAKNFHEIPADFQKTEPLKQACQILNQAVWTDQELYEYDKKRDEVMSFKSQIEGAEAKGKREQAYVIVCALLNENLSNALIMRATGLSFEEIEKIKQELKK